jgi:CDP-diacylglycerol--serine O-phosphatidyltransferase
MTLGNLFCGYACIVYAMRGEYETAAPFIGIAMVLDVLDGRIARMTGTSSQFGLEFDSLADVISFGMAPAILTFSWGLTSLGRWGWAAGFIYLTAAAMRLARFNVQTGTGDRKYFVGMPSPAAASVPAATIYAYPAGFQHPVGAVPALALVLVPAFLMVSTIRFRSFKNLDLQARRPYTVLIGIALLFAFVFAHPPLTLVTISYSYLLWAFIEMIVQRIRHRGHEPAEATFPASLSQQDLQQNVAEQPVQH